MTFYYNEQLKKYLIQFMAIFSGMKVKVGKTETEEERLISIPVYYGSMDRVVAYMMSAHTQNKPLRIPAMSAFMTSIDLAPDRRRGIGNTNRQTYTPLGGVVPDDVKVVKQYMPVPYWISTELQIYSSNVDQHLQCLEQILMLFDPILQIQKNDSVFDWTRITTVELTGIRHEINYPFGPNPRIIQSGLNFRFIAELSVPAEVKSQFVEDVRARIAAINIALDTANSQELIATLDNLNINYDLFATAKDLNFK